MSEIPNSECPRCGKGFTCLVKEGKSTCWCFGHSPLNEEDEVLDKYGENCLCEDCLTGTTQGKVREFMKIVRQNK